MNLFVVSDLHIDRSTDPLLSGLIAFLTERVKPGDCVVFAGDVFDVFIGNKKIFRDRYRGFIELVVSLADRGADVHYIEGNHDFQLKKLFGRLKGVTHHASEVEIQCGQKRVYIAHGDLVNSKDYGYRILRGVLRSVPLRAMIRQAPGKIVDGIGQWMSGQSKASHRQPQGLPRLSEGHLEQLRKCYRSFAALKINQGFDFVILGHCHDRDEMKFKVGDRLGHYMNVGYPRVHQSLVFWTPERPDELQREHFFKE